MAEAGARSGKRRPWPSTLARAALILLLLPQLAALWILHRPAPTGLPAGLVAALTDGLLDDATVSVARASVDNRGVFRLEGLRVAHAGHGLAFEGDARVLPPWQAWIAGRFYEPILQARGRLLELADGAVIADDVLLRAGDPDGAWLDVAARAGDLRLRLEARLPDLTPSPTPPRAGQAAAGLDWRRVRDALPRLRGDAELRLWMGGWSAEVALKGESAPGAGWRVGEVEGRITEDLKDRWGGLRATGLGHGDLEAGLIRAFGMPGTWSVVLENGRWGRLEGVGGAARLRARGDRGSLDLRLSARDSRVRLRLVDPRGPEGWRVEGVGGALRADELLRAPGVAEALRRAEIDLSGGVELGDVSVGLVDGRPARAEGWVAVRDAGWKAIRPCVIRPDRPASPLTGHASVDLAAGTFAATALDLAGLVGSIEGGLAAGAPYEVRLASSEGHPVHPGCLDSLLGAWWIDLWKRFDLSTSGEHPHADVTVRGAWGADHADLVRVTASLERFGFMGARFRRTDVRVTATPERTSVAIDRLVGELDGAPAGSAKGRVEWDWTSGKTQPLIRAEGDLHPLVALRLLEDGAAQVARLRGARFGEPWLKVEITPEGASAIELRTRGASEILGTRLGPVDLRMTGDGGADGAMRLGGSAQFAGGTVRVDLSGELDGRCEVREFTAEGVRWALLPEALPFLFKDPPADPPSAGILSGTFKGTVDLGAAPAFEGEGAFRFSDPQLRRVRLFGVLSQGLDTLGLGFSGYDLTEAKGDFRIKDGRATLPRLVIGGEDAELRLAGYVDLKSGGLNLLGTFELKDSPWGPLGFLNPNRLITKVIKIKVGGDLAQPETKVRTGF